jgi:electron transfer flavoprotein beta subunit
MKILVCISNVPDTTSKINFTADGKAFDNNGIQFVINPYDEFGLTKAIKLREQHGGSVTVAHLGEATSEPTLRKALAIGADDAIRIDAAATDSFFVAQELAHIAADYDLIICGRESIDYNGGAVPGMMAEILDRALINGCTGLSIDNGTATLEREIEGGKESMSAALPLVVAGQKGLVEESELLIPNMRGIMSARSKPLQVLATQGTEQRTASASFEKPAEKAACKLIEAGNEAELVALLHNEAKVI